MHHIVGDHFFIIITSTLRYKKIKYKFFINVALAIFNGATQLSDILALFEISDLKEVLILSFIYTIRVQS